MSTEPISNTAAMPGKYLTFRLGQEYYSLPVLKVREIMRLCPITAVPRMPSYLRGVINLRGKIVAVVDLRSRFQLPPQEDAERACTMDLKSAGNVLMLVCSTGALMGGSHRDMLGACGHADMRLPDVDPARGARTAHAVAACIAHGAVRSAHEPSEGGLLPALAEM